MRGLWEAHSRFLEETTYSITGAPGIEARRPAQAAPGHGETQASPWTYTLCDSASPARRLCLLQSFYIELGHLKHRLHHAICLFGIIGLQQLIQNGGNDLP